MENVANALNRIATALEKMPQESSLGLVDYAPVVTSLILLCSVVIAFFLLKNSQRSLTIQTRIMQANLANSRADRYEEITSQMQILGKKFREDETKKNQVEQLLSIRSVADWKPEMATWITDEDWKLARPIKEYFKIAHKLYKQDVLNNAFLDVIINRYGIDMLYSTIKAIDVHTFFTKRTDINDQLFRSELNWYRDLKGIRPCYSPS